MRKRTLFAAGTGCPDVDQRASGAAFLQMQTPTAAASIPMDEGRPFNNFGVYSRFICAAHGIQAAVLASQMWVLISKPGESNDPNGRRSQAPRRKEHICLFGEDSGGLCQKWMLPVLRDQQGRFSGLGTKEVLRGTDLEGFPHLLPQGAIEEEVRALATDLLKNRETNSPRPVLSTDSESPSGA